MNTGHDVDLVSRDDEVLRAIAFGRPTDDAGRERARAAARILGERTRDRAERATREAPDAQTVSPVSGPATAPMARDRDKHPVVETGDLGTTGDLDGTAPEREPLDPAEALVRRTRRRRLLLAGAIVASLVLGAVAGIIAERTGAVEGGDSLAVFDRPSTAEEDSVLTMMFGSQVAGEARLLRSDDPIRIYGVRVDEEGLFGAGSPGPQICVVAIAASRVYYPSGCIPELVFREQGSSGFLASVDTFITESTLVGGMGYTWGPRGDIILRDYTDDLFGGADGRFTPDELAQGRDLPAIRTVEAGPRVSTTQLPLDSAEFGPTQLGSFGSIMLVGTTRVPELEVRNGTGSEPEDLPALRIVCLTPVRASEVIASFCASMDDFRDSGITGSFDVGNGPVDVEWWPDGGLSYSDDGS